MMHDKVSVLLQSANIPVTQRRTCVLVLGMHRAGTSALARVLNLVGCDLPKTLIGANKSNETGHWESEAIARFNDRLLASAGSTWDDWLAFNPGWFTSPKAAQFHEEALSVLDEEFGSSRLFVLKDPRICRLAPFWMNVLAAHGIASRMLLPVRNPLEVARSLAARNAFEPALGNLIWLRHVLEAEHATRGRPRFFTSYDKLLKNWTSVIAGASEALELSWPCQPVRVDADVVTFLDRKHRHHEEAINDTLGNSNLSTWLRDAFRVFSDWSSSGEKPQDLALLDRIRVEFDAAAPAFVGLITSGRSAMQRNVKLQTEHKTLTDAVQVSERTIAGLRTKLEEIEKSAAEHASKARELECGVISSRKKLATQETTAIAIAAECDALKIAVRTAEEAHQLARVQLDESGKLAVTQLEKLQRLEHELNTARAREQERAQVLAATQHLSAELSRKLAGAEDLLAGERQELALLQTSFTESKEWVFRLSAERAALAMESQILNQRLAEHAERLQLTNARNEQLAAQNADMMHRLDKAASETSALEDTIAATRARLAENSVALSQESAAKKTAERCLSDRFDEIAALTRRLNEKEKELAAAQVSGVRGSEEAVTAVRKQVAEKDAQLAKRFNEIAALTQALQETERRLREKAGELSAAREQVSRTEAQISAAAERAQQQKKETELQLAERFSEIAKLTRLVNDSEAAMRKAEAQRDWIREASSVLVNGSRSVKGKLSGLLPAGWRRARQMQQLKEKGVFDADAYLSANPDVAKSPQDALRHYLRHGLTEGRALSLETKGGAKT
jgi:hypothetical protein